MITKKIIFIFIGGYLPAKKQGGPVTSISNMISHMFDIYEFKVACSDHEMDNPERYADIEEGWNHREIEDVYYLRDNEFTYEKFCDLIDPFKDKIQSIYLSGVYYIKMNLPAIRAAKKYNIPVVLAPRGDLMRNSIEMNGVISCIKKRTFLMLAKKLKLFQNITIQATSEEERLGAIRYLGVSDDNIVVEPNFPISPYHRCNYIKKENSIKLIFISRIMVKKNLKQAIEIVNSLPNDINVIFDIYGPIEQPEYWEECKKIIKQASKNHQISYKGQLDPIEAKKIYREYDAMLFPTLSENYGHVIAEALLNECMVFLTRGTTPWDACENNGIYLGELYSNEEFIKKIIYFAKMGSNAFAKEREKNRQFVQSYLKLDALKHSYIQMFER